MAVYVCAHGGPPPGDHSETFAPAGTRLLFYTEPGEELWMQHVLYIVKSDTARPHLYAVPDDRDRANNHELTPWTEREKLPLLHFLDERRDTLLFVGAELTPAPLCADPACARRHDCAGVLGQLHRRGVSGDVRMLFCSVTDSGHSRKTDYLPEELGLFYAYRDAVMMREDPEPPDTVSSRIGAEYTGLCRRIDADDEQAWRWFDAQPLEYRIDLLDYSDVRQWSYVWTAREFLRTGGVEGVEGDYYAFYLSQDEETREMLDSDEGLRTALTTGRQRRIEALLALGAAERRTLWRATPGQGDHLRAETRADLVLHSDALRDWAGGED